MANNIIWVAYETCVDRPRVYIDHFPLAPRKIFMYLFDCISSKKVIESAINMIEMTLELYNLQ